MPHTNDLFSALDTSTGVILLGGQENTLSVTRALGRLGVHVTVIAREECFALRSKYCAQKMVAEPNSSLEEAWFEALLGPKTNAKKGSIIFPCSDSAIAFIADHHDNLTERYTLEEAAPSQRLRMLDKLETIKAAKTAGIGAPLVWEVPDWTLSADQERSLQFPLMIKPLHSHVFSERFGCKLFIIEKDISELKAKLADVAESGIEVMLVEMIPGPDTLLSSYYTYRTKDGTRLFDFTKRVIRRYPETSGAGCFHETAHLPHTAEAGQRLFEHLEFQGLGNVEFKFDERDQQLKIIEVNARFTAAQELVRRAGAPIDVMMYAHLTGQSVPELRPHKNGLRMWYPFRDMKAFLALRKQKRLSTFGWLKSVFARRFHTPYFAWDDLRPVMSASGNFFRKRLGGRP